MAKTLATLVRTYFEGGTFRNNTVLMEIPDEAVERVQQIFEAGFQHGVNSIFEGGPEDE